MIACTGCGRPLESGEPMFEVACTWFYCCGCCLPGVAGEFPIVGDEVLVKTGDGYDKSS